jgi:large subunit ribosomal protein L3
MVIGIIGRKAGMTRIFTDEGQSVPVTVIEVVDNRIAQLKTVATDGYAAIQVASGIKKSSRVNKAIAGHYAKAGVEAGTALNEFRLQSEDALPDVGSRLSVDQFEVGQLVDVSGVSKGKGYAGAIKRWNFRMQDATHGNSLSHRSAGSIGMCQTPGRVFKGKKMAGHLGAANVTVQSLQVVRVCADKGLLLVKGAVPGATGSELIVKPAVKA